MKGLLAIVLLVSTLGVASLANAEDRWWATVIAIPRTDHNFYGAAWNYPTEEAAIRRAKSECGNPEYCISLSTGKNSCLLITVHPRGTPKAPAQGNWYSWFGDFPSEAAGRKEFQRYLKDLKERFGEVREIELLKCSGVK